MVSELGWDYNIKSGPPQSWDHGKDAQSYYHVISWFDLVMKSDTTIGDAELGSSAGSLSTTGSNTSNSNPAGPQTKELYLVAPGPSGESSEAAANAFLIMGHDDKVSEVKKTRGPGDGWTTEDTAPGIVEDGRIWRGVKTFRVPVFREIQISEEPNVGSESGAQPKVHLGQSRGGYRGRYGGRGNYRGRGNSWGTNRGAGGGGGGGGVSAERWAATRGW